jgi:hypothetical protein
VEYRRTIAVPLEKLQPETTPETPTGWVFGWPYAVAFLAMMSYSIHDMIGPAR